MTKDLLVCHSKKGEKRKGASLFCATKARVTTLPRYPQPHRSWGQQWEEGAQTATWSPARKARPGLPLSRASNALQPLLQSLLHSVAVRVVLSDPSPVELSAQILAGNHKQQ